jgi:hypothetical protein
LLPHTRARRQPASIIGGSAAPSVRLHQESIRPRFRESDLLRKLFETIFRLTERAKSGVH